MTDEAISKMAGETGRILSDAPWHVDCRHLVPSYNAMLIAARENHPEDAFLGALLPLDTAANGDVNAPVLTILLAQIRLALESLIGIGENGARREGEGERPPEAAASGGGFGF